MSRYTKHNCNLCCLHQASSPTPASWPSETARVSDIAEREKIRASAETELLRRHEEVGDRLAELEAEREVAAAEVPAAERRIFDEMADAYSGEAMAAVHEISRRSREYACGECNMCLPFETVAALMGATNSLVRCHACGRILFLQDDTRGALAKR